MSIEAAFAAGVTPEEFVEKHLPALYAPYADDFELLSDVPLTIGLRLEGDGGGEWTLFVDDLELDVEEGRAGTPMFTFVGDATVWDALRDEMRGFVQTLVDQRAARGPRKIEDQYRINDRRLNAFERLSGAIELVLDGVPGIANPLKATIVLNAFEHGRGKPLIVGLAHPDLMRVARGETHFRDLNAEKRIRIGGDVTLPVRLAGAFI